jgi:hypothetical protein
VGLPRWLRAIKQSDGPVALRASAYPPLVAFEDLETPARVFSVSSNGLERAFGPGVTLSRFSIASVDKGVEIGRL